jgi:transposase
MGRSISSDLRIRMVRGVADGKSRRAVAAQFEVSASTAVRVQARYAATGSVAASKQGRPAGSGKLGPYRQVLIDKVKDQPDITMPDLADWLEARHGVRADPSNLSKLLCKAGFSYKKTPSGVGERTSRRESRAPGLD